MANYCSFCGAELNESARFCASCGQKVGETPSDKTEESVQVPPPVIPEMEPEPTVAPPPLIEAPPIPVAPTDIVELVPPPPLVEVASVPDPVPAVDLAPPMLDLDVEPKSEAVPPPPPVEVASAPDPVPAVDLAPPMLDLDASPKLESMPPPDPITPVDLDPPMLDLDQEPQSAVVATTPPRRKGSGGVILVVILVLVLAGAAGWYFLGGKLLGKKADTAAESYEATTSNAYNSTNDDIAKLRADVDQLMSEVSSSGWDSKVVSRVLPKLDEHIATIKEKGRTDYALYWEALGEYLQSGVAFTQKDPNAVKEHVVKAADKLEEIGTDAPKLDMTLRGSMIQSIGELIGSTKSIGLAPSDPLVVRLNALKTKLQALSDQGESK